jgi:hypothetical protein
MLPHIFDDPPERTRRKLARLYALLVSANIGVWLWAVAALAIAPMTPPRRSTSPS